MLTIGEGASEQPLDRFRAEHHAPPMSKLPTMTSDELRAIRAETEWTQEEFAEKLGVNMRTVRKWENGERNIPGPVVFLARIRLDEYRKSKRIAP